MLYIAGLIRLSPNKLGKKKIPTTRIDNTISGTNIPNLGSVICLSDSPLYFPKKVKNTIIIEYKKVKILATQAKTGNSEATLCILNKSNSFNSSIAVKNISLLKNPLNGGNPAIEKLPIIAIVNEMGMRDISPPNLLKSRVRTLKSIIPITMNKAPLKVE